MSIDPPPPHLARERDRIVRAHVEAENRGDWEGALATFAHPRYEIVATGEVHDSAEEVRRFYAETVRAFPKIQLETTSLRHSHDAVLFEGRFVARHEGPWRGLPATNRAVSYAMLNVFVFEEDRLVCERLYFDLLTPLRQIGIARDPTTLGGRVAAAFNHPVTVGGAFLRGLLRRHP